MVIGITQDTVHFAVILAVGIGGEKFFPFAHYLFIFILYEIDLCNIVQGLLAVIRHLFQAAELYQRVIVFAGCIIDIGHIIGGRFTVLGTDLLYPRKISACLIHLAGLQ